MSRRTVSSSGSMESDFRRPPRRDFIHSYVRALRRHYVWVVAFWVVALLGSVYFAPQLLTRTELSFTAPPSSRAAEARKVLGESCPEQSKLTNLVLLIEAPNTTDVRTSSAIREFAAELNRTLTQTYGDYLWGVESYYSLLEQHVPDDISDQFLEQSEDGSIVTIPSKTIMVVSSRGDEASQESVHFANSVRDKANKLAADLFSHDGISVSVSGLPALYDGIVSSATHNLELMDATVVPMALLILAFLIKSLRMLAIPLCVLAVAASLSFATLDGFTYFGVHILTAAPSICASIFIALSLDYSMFFLTRFRLELEQQMASGTGGLGSPSGLSGLGGLSSDELLGDMLLADEQSTSSPRPLDSAAYARVVEAVMRSSGVTIFSSGLTLTICFLGLLCIPIDLIQSIGFGCSISLAYTIAVSLTLVPSLLFAFPRTCSRSFCGRCGGLSAQWAGGKGASSLTEDGVAAGSTLWMMGGDDPAPSRRRSTSSMHVRRKQSYRTSCWFKIAAMTQTRLGSLIVLACVAAAVTPLGMNAFDPKVTIGLDDYLPRGHTGVQTLRTLERHFSPGLAYPYSLVVRPREGELVTDTAFLEELRAVIQRWQGAANFSIVPRRTQILSLALLPGLDFVSPQSTHEALTHNCSGDIICELVAPQLLSLSRQLLNDEGTATIVQISLGVEPFSSVGQDWVHQFRNTIDADARRTGLRFNLVGFGADVIDAVHSLYALWPVMIAIVGCSVLLVVAITFRSLVAALRGCVTIGLTLLFVQGLGKLVYCDHIFAFTGFSGFTSHGGLIWLIPPTLFPLLCGIALDYDIFLLGRVFEFRTYGSSTRDSVLAGVAETGTVITFAGVIQALAFFGLLLSDIPVLNQMGFFLCVSVLWDTFVIRTLVVPSLMYWLGEVNWWPSAYRVRK